MSKPKVFAGMGIITLLALAIFGYLRLFHPRSSIPIKGASDFNYILITVDTLRADRIGCYGFDAVKTPTMDTFAARGIKFERCIAQTPLTLPSHASIMTGTYPPFHGVRDNGGFLVPQELSTLAEVMQQNGYSTSAFVAAYVLDAKWGLNQGFDTYFDRFDLSKYKTISLGHVQRRGDEVIDEVIPWLEGHKQQKFFTWIHLYDPHTPYDPPPPFRDEYANRPYAGEIAYTDAQLARLWQYLNDSALLENTILVFASDHGESLGEHEESTHGFFIYQAGVHVPLIIVTPFKELQGISRSGVVSLVDIMPTVLELAGTEIPAQVQGESLVSRFERDLDTDLGFAYSETYYPRFHYGWSELKSIQDRRYKLIVAPRLELYDLEWDPEEARNLIDDKAGEARRLLNLVTSFSEEAGRNGFEMDYSKMDEESRQKLAALGYIGTFASAALAPGRRMGDPKDKIAIFNQLSQARELGMQGEFERAEAMMYEIIAADPEVIDAYFALGNLYFRKRDFQQSLDTFKKVLEKRPHDNFTVVNIANAYISLNRLDEAKKVILESLESLTPDSQIHFILGNIYNSQKDYDQAKASYQRCIELNPASASAYNALGGIAVTQSDLAAAEGFLKKAMDLNPKLLNLQYYWAQLYEAKGDFDRAMDAYEIELENIPHNFRASYNLARLHRMKGNTVDEQKYLEHTIQSNPNFPLSYFYLARIHLNQGENYRQAVAWVEKGIALKPEKEYLPLGYFLLADLYSRLGEDARSNEWLNKGKQAQKESAK